MNEGEERTVNVGYDPGFGNNKMAAVLAGEMRTAVVPSVVGVGDTDMGLLGRAAFGGRRVKRPYCVTFDGLTYVVGQNVKAFCARPAQRLDFHRLSDGPELRALFYVTAYALLGGGHHTASMVIGLPVEVMKDRTVALQTLRTLRRWVVGTHDFAAFASAGCTRTTTVRTLHRVHVRRHYNTILIDVEGSGFLYNQVRNMVGTLVEVGRGHWPPERVADILASRDRRQAGPTAAAHGLCLQWIKYPPDRSLSDGT